MKEEEIVRTSIYLPKSLFLAIRSKQINLSREVREYLYQRIQEDEEQKLIKEIEEHKKIVRQLEAKLAIIKKKKKEEEEKRKILYQLADKIAKWLDIRLRNIPEKNQQFFINKTIEILKSKYNVELSDKHIISLSNKIKSNGNKIKIEDILQILEGIV